MTEPAQGILIACPEVTGGEVMEFLRGLWRVDSLSYHPLEAPEAFLATADESAIRECLPETPTHIAIAAHAGCTHHAVAHEEQLTELRTAVDRLAAMYPAARVAGIALGADGRPLKIEL